MVIISNNQWITNIILIWSLKEHIGAPCRCSRQCQAIPVPSGEVASAREVLASQWIFHDFSEKKSHPKTPKAVGAVHLADLKPKTW